MSASLVHPSLSLGTVQPAEPQGSVGGGSPLRPLTPSQFAERLYSTTPAEPATSVCHSGPAPFRRATFPASAPRWYDLPFTCVFCEKPSTDWILAQMNSARDCVCRSCAPLWYGPLKSTFSFASREQRNADRPGTVSAVTGRRRYFLDPLPRLKSLYALVHLLPLDSWDIPLSRKSQYKRNLI